MENEKLEHENQQQTTQQPQQTPTPPTAQNQNSKSNGLAIASLVLGILGLVLACLGIGAIIGAIAVIFAIIVLATHKGGKGLAIAGLVTGIIAIIIGASIFGNSGNKDVQKEIDKVVEQNESSSNDNNVEATEEATPTTEPAETAQPTAEPTAEPANETLTVGSTYEKNGLKVTLTDYNPEYICENQYMQPADGMKYIEFGFTYENTGSDGDKYVSIYDCDCYADNTLCDAAYIGSNDFINANISPGRNVSFKIYFQVPAGAQSIELEYNSNSFWSSEKVVFKIQ